MLDSDRLAATLQIELRDETDLDGFRAACRRLVAASAAPESVHWCTPAGAGSAPFAGEAAAESTMAARRAEEPAAQAAGGAQVGAEAPPVRAPAFFLDLCTVATRVGSQLSSWNRFR